MHAIVDDSAHLEIIKSIKGRKKGLLESQKLFVDEEFSPDLKLGDRTIVWKRIKDIDDKATLYFDESPLKGKMVVGTFGNQDVQAVFSAMSNHQRLLDFVCPPDQNFDSSQYCGLFYFRFWKMGNWVYVIVDDRVPVLGSEKENKKLDKGKLTDSYSSKGNSQMEVAETKTRLEERSIQRQENRESKNIGDTDQSKTAIYSCTAEDVSEGGDVLQSSEDPKCENADKKVEKLPQIIDEEPNMSNKQKNAKESGDEQLFSVTLDEQGNRCYWTTLLEKAYAKFCGGYEILRNVVFTNVLQDMTGGIIEIYDSHHLPPNFFLELKSYSDKNCIIVASANDHEIEGKESAVIPNINVMAVTQVLFADFRKLLGREKMLGLVRLKTFGDLPCWNEKWIEATKDWEIIPVLARKKLKMVARVGNEFYMTYKNFLSAFSKLYVSSTADGSNYNCEGYFSDWIKPRFQYNISQTDELKFHEFRQHKIWIRDPNDLNSSLSVEGSISLTREWFCTCSGNLKPCCAMQIYLFPLGRGVDLPVKFDFFRFTSPVGCSELSTDKNLTVRFSLHPGHYLVVPALIHTSWSRPNEPLQYLLRVVTPSYVMPIDEAEPVCLLADGCVSQNTNFDLIDVAEEKPEIKPREKMSETSSKQTERKTKEKGKKKR